MSVYPVPPSLLPQRVIHIACDDCTSSSQKQVKILSCAFKVNFKKFKKGSKVYMSCFLCFWKIGHMHNKKYYNSKVVKPLKMAYPWPWSCKCSENTSENNKMDKVKRQNLVTCSLIKYSCTVESAPWSPNSCKRQNLRHSINAAITDEHSLELFCTRSFNRPSRRLLKNSWKKPTPLPTTYKWSAIAINQ